MKRCYKCGEQKTLDSFRLSPKRGDGLAAECNACLAEYAREWRKRDASKKLMRGYALAEAARNKIANHQSGILTARSRAEKAGEKKYIGKLCKKCGGRERFTENSMCVPCAPEIKKNKRAAKDQWRFNNRERYNEYMREAAKQKVLFVKSCYPPDI